MFWNEASGRLRRRCTNARDAFTALREQEGPLRLSFLLVEEPMIVRDAVLTPNRVVYSDDFGLAWLNPQFGQDRHKTRAKSVKLLLRIPHLAHLHLVA